MNACLSPQKPFLIDCPRVRGLRLCILYEDHQLIAAVKPAGIPSQADKTAEADMLTLLKDYRKVNENKAGEAWLGLLHRLDRPVGGIMLFAKTSKAAARMSESFRKREIHKKYLAVVRGCSEEEGSWIDFIAEKKKNGRYHLVEEGAGKRCDLSFRRLGCDLRRQLSLLEIELGSGRGHQIRVQCQSRGLPLAGDRRYGIMDDFDRALPAPALLAYEISFPHPISREEITLRLEVEARPPWSYFANELARLGS